jgi:hypothetical protein
MMKNAKRLNNLIKQYPYPDSADGASKKTKTIGVRFYQGQAYYGKRQVQKDSDSEDAK